MVYEKETLGELSYHDRIVKYRRETMGQTPFKFEAEWVVPLAIMGALMLGVMVAKKQRKKKNVS